MRFRILILFFITLFIPRLCSAEFFNWMIVTSPIGKPLKANKLPDHIFITDYSISSEDWECTITKPKGFKTDGYPGGGELYQEGSTIFCEFIKNKDIIVRDYGACTKWTKGPEKGFPTENSGASLNLEGPNGLFEIKTYCSENSWKKK